MKNRLIVTAMIACAIMAATAVYAQNNDAVKPASAPATTMGLKDAFAGKFLIGTATDLRSFRGALSEEVLANIKANYNVITPENCMKPQNAHPSENTFNWATPDALVKWCGEHNIKVWGHTLVWHQQTGAWFFQPGEGATTVTREVAMARLKNHIQTEVGRYKGCVMGWDVVNEAIDNSTTSGSESLRKNSWYQAVGPEVLTLAFKWAHEADPDALLFYNDYNIEQGALKDTGKHAASLLLLKRLIKECAPISGVGIQGHWSVRTNLEEVEKAISNYEALGLKIAISELDVAVAGENSGQFPTRFGGAAFGGNRPGAPGATRGDSRRGDLATTRSAAMGGMRGMRGRGITVTASPEALKRQAEVYAKLFQIFQRHSKSVMRVTFWGINDATSWKRGQLPLLFDGQMKPKPAYQAILDVAAGKSIALQP